jgi:flagellar hook-associated protein 3 FlgL
MRIASNTFTDNFLQQISTLQQQENQLQSQASSGLKVSLPEDNPTTMTEVLNLQTQAAQTTQYSQNVSSLQTTTTTAYTAIQSLQNLMDQASTIASNASNSTNASSMPSYLTQIQGIIQQVMAVANTQDADGNYIFSGVTTNTKPFTAATNSSGNYTSVTFNGSQGVNQILVAPNLSVTAQVPGVNTSGIGAKGLFQDTRNGSDIFAHLISLQNDLVSGNQTAIGSTDIPSLLNDTNNIADQMGEIGAKQSLLNSTASSLSAVSTNITTQISGLTSADMATTLTKLQQTQTAYEAALQSGVKVFSLSLMNYLSGTSVG